MLYYFMSRGGMVESKGFVESTTPLPVYECKEGVETVALPASWLDEEVLSSPGGYSFRRLLMIAREAGIDV